LSAQIYLNDVDIEAPFLGTDPQQVKAANFIGPFIRGNSVPPFDQGFFHGSGAADFKRNLIMLVEVIVNKYLH
jgi:hypothetical protein